ncbi:nucleotidyltransferase [Caldimicrobium thiodismutans]|uniref:Nucleotidyltransferase n=1 Tax=Caldimicrobium thiodismutans TaxID=1653476 RepID=A0A0U5BXI8_9BACT|nr:nucleotidyltransferase substrate binding protein [Caldimicrobium thiodismutans]BAU23429.1 nucleotidyltransferase [Caldimicrobium thiodismutans]
MEKFRRSLERFERAFRKFEEILGNPLFEEVFSEDFQIEILTKRFEYTFEAMWKAIKEFLCLRGIECYSPRSCFESLLKEGLISQDYEENLYEMLLIRKFLVQIYDEETAKKYYKEIKKDIYYQIFKEVLTALRAHSMGAF